MDSYCGLCVVSCDECTKMYLLEAEGGFHNNCQCWGCTKYPKFLSHKGTLVNGRWFPNK